jgi:hypothetical protein
MRYLILWIAAIFVFLGCSTPQEQAARQQGEMDRMIGEFGPACYKLGYPANSDAWRDCVVRLGACRHRSSAAGGTSVAGGAARVWGQV